MIFTNIIKIDNNSQITESFPTLYCKWILKQQHGGAQKRTLTSQNKIQFKAQDFHKSLSESVARAPIVLASIRKMKDHLTPQSASMGGDYWGESDLNTNKAVLDFKK